MQHNNAIILPPFKIVSVIDYPGSPRNTTGILVLNMLHLDHEIVQVLNLHKNYLFSHIRKV